MAARSQEQLEKQTEDEGEVNRRVGVIRSPVTVGWVDPGETHPSSTGRLNPSYVALFYVPELAYRRQGWKNSADDKEDRGGLDYGNYRAKTADIVTLSLSGKLDTTTAKTFEEKILGQMESGDRRFIIDLAQLDYISSAGLRVFSLAGKRLDSANGKMVLCGFKKTIPYNTLNVSEIQSEKCSR